MNQSEEQYTAEAIADPHVHLREIGWVMSDVVRDCYDGGSDVIGPQPNTNSPRITEQEVSWYINSAKTFVNPLKPMSFIPFVMLTECTTRAELEKCVATGIRDGKIYPYMRTTKSAHGVHCYSNMIPIVRWCGELGIKVHAHFEHPNSVHPNRDAEYLCLPIAEIFLESTKAIIVWEHGSDGRCVRAWKKFANDFPGRFYLMLTAHHLAWDEDSAFGDVRKKCKPPIKTDLDRLQLISLIGENHYWVMAGSDAAPHDVENKHAHKGKCSCGDYTAPFLHLLYAHALSHLFLTPRGIEIYINFTSRNARSLHKLPRSSRNVILVRKPFTIPPFYKVGDWTVEPPGVGEVLEFQIAK